VMRARAQVQAHQAHAGSPPQLAINEHLHSDAGGALVHSDHVPPRPVVDGDPKLDTIVKCIDQGACWLSHARSLPAVDAVTKARRFLPARFRTDRTTHLGAHHVTHCATVGSFGDKAHRGGAPGPQPERDRERTRAHVERGGPSNGDATGSVERCSQAHPRPTGDERHPCCACDARIRDLAVAIKHLSET
jgi:hypothetical protein